MDPLTAVAASGLRARMESLDLVANNLANAATGGYKADREFYNLYTAPEALEAEGFSSMPLVERPWVDLSQGVLQATGNPLDVALSGQGFFAVNGPSGPLYTRNGNFHLSAAGSLVTADGYAVRGASGTPLQLQASRSIEIASDGTISQNGQVVGKLEVVDFTGAEALTKQGSNYFRASDAAQPPSPPAATSIQQGKLEDSNTGGAEASVRLVSIMRQFEMLQKAMSLGDQMNRQAVEQVAKVGS